MSLLTLAGIGDSSVLYGYILHFYAKLVL